MKKNSLTSSGRRRAPTHKLLLTSTRGRLAALFVLLAAAVLVGSTHSSATSGGPSGAVGAAPVESGGYADSLAAEPFTSDLKRAETEREREAEKRAAKRVRSGAAAKSGGVRSRSSKSERRGGRAAARTGKPASKPQAQTAQSAESRITTHSNELGQTVYSIAPSGFDVSPPLTELATSAPELRTSEETEELPFPSWRIPRSNSPDPVTQAAPTRGVRSPNAPVTLAAPSTGFNFAGITGSGSFPPDNNGSVGNDQYVETVNTRYQVWSLNRANNTVTSVAGPSNINSLWSGFVGSNCSTRNDGDPVVLYDKVANRWLISQFTSAATGGFYYQCVAISTTPNAAGTYYRYAFAVPNGNFGDYPHYGVWTDAYYMMAHGFTAASGGSYTGALFAAMDRTKMLAGDSTATWQVIIDPAEGGHMPADLDGFAPPPGGAPGIFVSLHSDGMYLYRMKVDFATPANTARTLQAKMPVAPSTAACGGGNCIPQPGSTATVDSLADRLMFRLAYRNFVDHESLVISHSVDPSITGVLSGVRWYDFRISGTPDATCATYPCAYQQGTIADAANGRSRWMPSMSMDGAENILVGYSTTGKTNATENHSIRYTGRAKTDPLGVMTAPEATVFTGTRNVSNTQLSPGRWGDYTSMSIDPADDCTFWYANEYYVTGTTGNGTWRTRIASSRFPDGTGAGQCSASTCTTRPTDAPVIGSASVTADNQVQLTWTAVSPAPGSYAVERAVGSPGSEGLYRPLAYVAGTETSYIDATVQGGLTYTYRVIAATDSTGRCQSLARSGTASATATGTCNLKPTFGGATSATSGDGASCAVTVHWTPAASSCPLTPTVRYNVFRGTTPDFTPSAANRIASCVTGPDSYTDSDSLASGTTYYYVVRAEDNSSANGGECGGGNEESNSVVVSGAAYGPGTQPTPGTWTDGGGDGTAFLRLNTTGAGNTADQVWRFVKTANDAGANHTPGGSYAYRTAGPGASATYGSNECAVAETPVLTAGAATINLTYWERHQIEKGWDGVAIEYSRNGGPWTDMTAPSNLPTDGCLVTDVTTDYATLGCTGAPPANACGYSSTKSVITGPVGSGTSCTNWVTGSLTAYARRCHLLTGLNPGDTVQFRWRFTSDSAAEFAGFYLDDIAVTNILLPDSCTTYTPPVATDLSVAPATGTYGGTVNLSATLTSGGGPVSGKSVAFTLNSASVGSAMTDASGVATLSNVSLAGINAGSYPNGVGASFAGDASYLASSGSNSLTVNKATPVITWSNPADITYPTALSGTQLNASANAPGSFTYTPAAGTVLGKGNGQNLHADFTPTDTANYNGATKDVSINVLSAVLNVSMTADRNPAIVGLNFNYKPVITNTGNASATNVVLTDVLPSQVTFTAASSSQGSCSYDSVTKTVTCNLGTITAGSTVNVQITAKPRDEGTLNDTASITAGQWDPATGNSSASVNGLQAVKQIDLSVQMTNAPDPIFVSQQTVYTMVVKNNSTVAGATGITLTDSLPASLKFVSATTSQGSLVTPPVGSSGIVTANIGSLAANTTATVTLTVSASASGLVTNTASVSATESDPNTANNTAGTVTTVKDAALQKVLLTKQVLTGGCENTTGNVYLTGPAPAGGLTVDLSSNITGASVPVNVFIPAGQTVSPAFNVTTSPVAAKQVGLITATLGASSVSRGITINVGSGVCPP
jgi:uncharacterized repeat protein (TIGR01451 family)